MENENQPRVRVINGKAITMHAPQKKEGLNKPILMPDGRIRLTASQAAYCLSTTNTRVLTLVENGVIKDHNPKQGEPGRKPCYIYQDEIEAAYKTTLVGIFQQWKSVDGVHRPFRPFAVEECAKFYDVSKATPRVKKGKPAQTSAEIEADFRSSQVEKLAASILPMMPLHDPAMHRMAIREAFSVSVQFYQYADSLRAEVKPQGASSGEQAPQ